MNTLRELAGQLVAELRVALRASSALRWALWWQAILLAVSAVALPFDSRHILGLSPWIKPMKFELSVMIFLLTIAVFLHALATEEIRQGEWRRSRLWLGWGFAACMTVENTVIALQSARGVRSHMNYTTLRDGVLFAVMGVFILLNTLLVAWLLALWCVARPRLAAATRWGVSLGLTMLLLGSIEGVAMVQHGAHTIGAHDGPEGLPFLNWSRSHGDLRVAHFFALHALQIFPLAGFLLARTRWRPHLQVVCVCLFAVVYTSAVWWLFAEAMRGRPLMAY